MAASEHKPLLRQSASQINYIASSGNYGASTSLSQEYNTRPGAHPQTQTYWYRWYILGLFSLIGALENVTWNTWGPIEASSSLKYGWTKGTVSLLADWGAITFVLFVFPTAWLLDVKGLRTSVLLCSASIAVGCALRIISSEPNTATPLIHMGQFVIGIGGPVGQSSATVLSSTWFPANQRTTATAVASLAAYVGTAISFVIGPGFVTDVEKLNFNLTTRQDAIQKVGGEIMNLLYLEFGLGCLFFVLVLFTFPAKPPLPPSTTAALERLNFAQGLKELFLNPQFQLIAFVYGITTGVYSAWCSDLALNLSAYNIDNDEASWFGFWAVVAGAVSGIVLSLITDWFGGFMKAILLGLFILASVGFTVFTLMCVKIIPPSIGLLYATSAVGGLCLNGAIPLFFELSVEASYPVAEGINTCYMTFSNNVFCLIFLTLPMIPGTGTTWMNWVLVGSCVICIPLMFFFKEKHKRLAVDVRSGCDNSNINAPSIA